MCANLGIAADFEKLICEEVTVCLHTAATIRFDEGLKKTVLTNTRGTKYFLELASKMKNVQVSDIFVLYSNYRDRTEFIYQPKKKKKNRNFNYIHNQFKY